ncbi:hypothetical protein HUZ36_05185 [Pseudoalteromonas sp. McH1-7]|uniref:hypothetical protein n=1 Tax=Pseudoalteromonas sp. McH1-7 TaxID=2745574 RepID=UPI0015918A0E|nr:hypothetical protein [Pseudoalteromonas sp. McH1-7]NUZ10168.1 hypothetical protein [Pseudoalteromonas sp. McH1-7]
MSRYNSSSDTAGAFTFIILAIGGFLTWEFSQLANLPWDVGAKVFGFCLLSLVLAGAARYLFGQSNSAIAIWPLFLLGVYWSFFPAFNYWGGLTEDSVLRYVAEEPWYTLWYVKALISVAIVVGGYWLDSKLNEWF